MDSNPPNMSSWPLPHPTPQYHREAWKRETKQEFWQKQMLNIQVAEEFKSQLHVPLARIKRIMKSSGDAKMLSAEAPILMAKACDIFIQELALRAWMQSQENNNCVVQSCDAVKAILENNAFDFLTDVLPIDLIDACTKDAQEGNDLNVFGGNQAPLSHAAGFDENQMMNMNVDQGTSNQQFPQTYMTQQQVMPSHQFPHNFPPM